ncbi:MAG: hypothetical protein AAFV53_10865 [Myxococcota bacterium]
MSKLNQIIAVEKGIKSRVYGRITALHKQAQKIDPYNGFAKTFRKVDEEGEDYPPERKKVQLIARDVLREVARLQSELFDVTATKDWANCDARADVVVDGVTLIQQAPVTYLLFLEKQIGDIRTFIDKMPTLDESEEWESDPNSHLFRTPKITTHKTKKVQRPIVLYDATEHHPAQTQLITEDVIVGYWETVKHSGAIPVPRKQIILERIDKLIRGIRYAREAANAAEAPDLHVGESLFGYLLAD